MKNILILAENKQGFEESSITKKLAYDTKQLINTNIFDNVLIAEYRNNEDDCGVYGNIYSELNDCMYETVSNATEDLIEAISTLNDCASGVRIFVAGVDTDKCVLKTVTSLTDNKIKPFVLTNYCHSLDGMELHNAGVLLIERIVGKEKILSGKLA